MKLYGGCVEDVLGVSVRSSSLSSSTDSSEFSSSSSSSSGSSVVEQDYLLSPQEGSNLKKKTFFKKNCFPLGSKIRLTLRFHLL